MASGKERKLDKLDGAIAQIEAAVYLYLRNFPPEPVHTLVHAARSVLLDLHSHTPNKFMARLLQSEDDWIKDEYQKEWRILVNRASNFLKHADRDPKESLTGIDLNGVNQVEILHCIIAVWHYPGRMTSRLGLGLMYFGLLQRRFFDLEGLVRASGIGHDMMSEYAAMPDPKLKALCMAAFEFGQP